MNTEKRSAYFVALDMSDKARVEEKLTEMGEWIEMTPDSYLLEIKGDNSGQILFELDPKRLDAVKQYVVLQAETAIWIPFGDERDARIEAMKERTKK